MTNEKIKLFKTSNSRSWLHQDMRPCGVEGSSCAAQREWINPRYVRFMTYALVKSIDINNYDDPLTFQHKELEHTDLGQKFRFSTKIDLYATELTTNKGIVLDDIEKTKIISVETAKQISQIRDATHPYLDMTDLYWIEDEVHYTLELHSTNVQKQISRTYYSLIDCLSSIGGVLVNIYTLMLFFYAPYNFFHMLKMYLINMIIGKESLYDQDVRISDAYFSLYIRTRYWWLFCCCPTKTSGKKTASEINSKQDMFFRSWNMLNSRLEIKNFLHDSMDLQILRGLILKSRHRILTPLLVMHKFKNAVKLGGTQRQVTSFTRNLGDGTDNPCFTIQDALTTIKDDTDATKTPLDQLIDAWFQHHLPQGLLDSEDFKGRDRGIVAGGKPKTHIWGVNNRKKIVGKEVVQKKNKYMSDYDLDSVDVNVENGTAMNRNGDHSRSGTMVGRSPGRGTTMGGARKTSQISTPGKKRSSVGVDYAKLEKYGSHAIGRQMTVNMSRGRPSRIKTPIYSPDGNRNDDSPGTAHSKFTPKSSTMEQPSEDTENGVSHNQNDQHRDSSVIPLNQSKFGTEQVAVEPNKKSNFDQNGNKDGGTQPRNNSVNSKVDEWQLENVEENK